MTVKADTAKAERLLADVVARVRNPQPFLAAEAQGLVTLVDDSFRASRTPWGEPWAPNSPATIRAKGSSKPNIDTGRMRQSVNARVYAGTLAVGSNVEYAPFADASRPFLPRASRMTGPAAAWLQKVKTRLVKWIKAGRY